MQISDGGLSTREHAPDPREDGPLMRAGTHHDEDGGALDRQRERTAKLNSHYESLAFELNDGDKGRFLSGWQCENPYADQLLAATRERGAKLNHVGYSYFDDERLLVSSICQLHEHLDGRSPPYVFCGSGSTSLLFGFATYLQSLGVRHVYFIPPVYFTLQIALARFGIRTISVSAQQPFEKGFTLDLPDEKGAVLIITDPTWYVGIPLSRTVIDSISAWQVATTSIVFVDGSLQYLPWNGPRSEETAGLDPSLTFRLICPSKQLSIHGYRFAYVLMPQHHKQGFAWTYTNMLGPVNVDSIAFAYEAVDALLAGVIPRLLMEKASGTHRRLRERNVLSSPFDPCCGYFVFEKIESSLPNGYLRVDGRYFEQSGFPDHVKVNLLSPSIPLIDV
jgi:histidinol-phosphate/aromatic aminotransferase/cobyric acid decarboxylase-like protein